MTPPVDVSIIDVSIIVVSYNTCEETLACLASVYEQTQRATFELLVVDNQSNDGSADAIRHTFAGASPRLTLIEPGENLGFAGANNLAAQGATGEYLLLLNPDTVILDGAIDRIVEFARQHPQAGVYGGRTYFGDMSLNPNSCHNRPTPWSLFCMGTGLSALMRGSALFHPEGLGSWPRDTVRTVDCITGCFLLIRRQLWEQLSGFDLDYFMYGEDTDLCIRAQKLGATCMHCPDAKLIHYGGRSEKVRGDKMVRLFRAKHQLMQKHWNPRLVKFGGAMLASWALTRGLALTLLGTVQPARRAAAKEWRSVFARRREYTSTEVTSAASTAKQKPSLADAASR